MKVARWWIAAGAMAAFACGGDDEAEGGEAPEQGGGEAPEVPAEPALEPSVCLGDEHSCLLEADGTVLCWGGNLEGALGDGTREERRVPAPVVGLTGARQIACGEDHTCAVRADGRVTCWGSNDHGQLGAGNTDIQLRPVEVAGLLDAVEVQLGYDFTCARRRDGTVSCWGSESEGNLGPGVNDDQSSPRPVQGIGGAIGLAVGTSYACAITAGGALSCWGSNGFGQLGRGQGGSSAGVAPVTGLAGVTSVALGNGHACAAHGAGASCWGYDGDGQLGNGEGAPDRQPAPVPVQGLPEGIAQVALGSGYSCARTNDGKVFCWGSGGETGVAGATDSADAHVAREVTGLTGVRFLATGYQHACALTAGGALHCWGSGPSGQLGNGERHSETPMSIFPNVAQVSAQPSVLPTFTPTPSDTPPAPEIVVGREVVCSVLASGRIRCFGSGQSGVLGNGSERSIAAEQESYVHGISDARQLDVWWQAGCAVRAGGQLACWGTLPLYEANRQVAPTGLPREIAGVTDAAEVAVGQTAICVRHQTGAVSCMGQGSNGQLGNGANTSSATLVPVQGLTDAVDVDAGYSTVCARRQGGTLSCWGYGGNGELGNGGTTASNVPVEVPGLAGVTDVAVDYYHVCAVHSGGRVSCWGKNDSGQLGNGRMGEESVPSPAEVPGIRDAARVFAYQSQTCVVRTNGEAACWGSNSWGGAGLDDSEPTVERVLTPTPVARTTNADVAAFGPYVSYAPGMNFSCGLHTSGNISCSGITPIRPAGFFGGGARSRAPIAAPSIGIAAVQAAPPPQ